MECYARESIAAVAESLSSVAAGDVLGAEGGYGAGAGLLEYLLEGEEAVSAVSPVDARDEELLGFGEGFVAAVCFSIFGLCIGD